jgi:hypothetical protein
MINRLVQAHLRFNPAFVGERLGLEIWSFSLP